MRLNDGATMTLDTGLMYFTEQERIIFEMDCDAEDVSVPERAQMVEYTFGIDARSLYESSRCKVYLLSDYRQ